MKKLFAFAATAVLCSTVLPSSAHAAYLFGFSPTGSQTLTINGTTVIQAHQMGWFDAHGEHIAGNSNYYVSDADEGDVRNFFGFDLSNISEIVTSAVLNISNDPSAGVSGAPFAWTLFDVENSIDSSVGYQDVGIWSDLGSGASYGAVNVAGPTSNVSLALNSTGLNSLNRAAGSSFYVGGSLASVSAAVPEPASWLMMILGFAAVGGTMRSRNRRSGHVHLLT